MTRDAFLQALTRWYETLTPESVARVAEFYSVDAHFIDPFNDVRGLSAIERIFRHMFDQVEAPSFAVEECYVGESGAMLRWTFRFGSPEGETVVEGCSRLVFDAAGKIAFHRDYWDPAASLFMRVPLLGGVLRWLYRRLRA